MNEYDVDGVHLDYIRHPNRVGVNATRLSYLPNTISTFNAQLGLNPCGGGTTDCQPLLEWTAEWDQWREEQITLLVQGVADDLRNSNRPAASVSAATLARWDIGQGRSLLLVAVGYNQES